MEQLTQAQLKQVLFYAHESGCFYRLNFSGNNGAGKAKKGLICSQPDDRGYLRIRVYGKKYRAHRLAWLYVYGYFPEHGLDHVNGDKLDNRIENLRKANQAENLQNCAIRQNKTSTYIGVSWYPKTNKWKAQISVNNKKYALGYYETQQDARDAYRAAKSKLHTFNPIERSR